MRILQPLDWLLGPRIPRNLWVRLPADLQVYKRFTGRHMDPITAIFNFLSTPAGQQIVLGIEAEVRELVKLFHQSKVAATPQK